MTCASCAVSVESILKSQPGVVNAAVNFASANSSNLIIPETITPESLRKAVQSIGYDLLTDESGDKNEKIEKIQNENFRQLKWRTTWAIILSVPVVVIAMFFMEIPYANQIMWALSTPVVLWFGKDFLSMPGNRPGTGLPIWIPWLL